MSKRETSLKLPPRHQLGVLGMLGSRNGAIRSRSERRQPGRSGNALCGMRTIERDVHIVAGTDLLLILDTLRLLRYIHIALLICHNMGRPFISTIPDRSISLCRSYVEYSIAHSDLPIHPSQADNPHPTNSLDCIMGLRCTKRADLTTLTNKLREYSTKSPRSNVRIVLLRVK
jgi:hypothetical protein